MRPLDAIEQPNSLVDFRTSPHPLVDVNRPRRAAKPPAPRATSLCRFATVARRRIVGVTRPGVASARRSKPLKVGLLARGPVTATRIAVTAAQRRHAIVRGQVWHLLTVRVICKSSEVAYFRNNPARRLGCSGQITQNGFLPQSCGARLELCTEVKVRLTASPRRRASRVRAPANAADPPNSRSKKE